jgi:hypothetical protein
MSAGGVGVRGRQQRSMNETGDASELAMGDYVAGLITSSQSSMNSSRRGIRTKVWLSVVLALEGLCSGLLQKARGKGTCRALWDRAGGEHGCSFAI